jgi:hypothetical protein
MPEMIELIGRLDQWLSIGLPKPTAWEPMCTHCLEESDRLVPDNPAHQRIWHDSGEGLIVSDADPVAHSEQAMRVLMEGGVEAYHAFLAAPD